MEIVDSLLEIAIGDLSILGSGRVEYLEFSLSQEVAEEFKNRLIENDAEEKYQVDIKGILFERLFEGEVRNVKAFVSVLPAGQKFDEYAVQIRRKQ